MNNEKSLTLLLNKAFILLAGLIALHASPPAQATEWTPLPGTESGDQYFYDRSKLTFKEDGITYWKKVIFKVPQSINGKEATSGLLRERMQCTEHTSKLISYLYRAANGETVQYVANDESEPAPIIPDTVDDLFDRTLCPMVWQKQEEARIKSEQKSVETELKETVKKHKEDKKTAVTTPIPPNVRLPQKPVTPLPMPLPAPTPLPMPQIMDQLY